jgi:hypothetical protein
MKRTMVNGSFHNIWSHVIAALMLLIDKTAEHYKSAVSYGGM